MSSSNSDSEQNAEYHEKPEWWEKVIGYPVIGIAALAVLFNGRVQSTPQNELNIPTETTIGPTLGKPDRNYVLPVVPRPQVVPETVIDSLAIDLK